MEKNFWKIGIDTGGTFTDCIGQDPEGRWHRTKVLSSGAIRGQVLSQPDKVTLQLARVLGGETDLFVGYALRFLNMPAETYRITASSTDNHCLTLDRPVSLPVLAGAGVELTAGEEAPVLAARIMTGTPLTATLPLMEMRLGSTRGTNALLERKGAEVGLLITAGLGDLLEIGTQQRPHLFALHVRKPPQLYRRVIEVHERLDAAGGVLLPLLEVELERVVGEVKRSGISVWAIAFLHSYLNPAHETVLRQRLHAAGISFISLSAELMPAIKLVPRAQTAIVNAYLSPVINRYLEAVREKLSAGSTLRVMTSAGGLVETVFFTPKDSLLSGPAGGVVGAAAVAHESGIPKILTLDMGGTSTDVARYDGAYDYRYDLRVGDAHLQSPALAVETVAAGGGSVCTFDGITCAVGPDSAGANPGPACYGAGGPLTVTDVNLLLGRVDSDIFGIPLNAEAARRAFQAMNQKGLVPQAPDEEGLLAGFLQIANERMADAIRRVSVQKGYDPSEYTLLAFGGAGGQHACQVAALLKMNQVLIPADAGLLSAYGMGRAAIERFSTRQILQSLAGANLLDIFEQLTAEVFAQLAAEGFAPDQIYVARKSLFLRFSGQDAAIEIPFGEENDPVRLFREKYEALYGHWIENRTLEVESAKVIGATKMNTPGRSSAAVTLHQPRPYKHQRLFAGSTWQEVPVYRWPDLLPGAELAGPALLVSPTSTTVVEPNWHFQLDAGGNGLLQKIGTGALVSVGEGPADGAVQLALFTNRFTAIAGEMGALLERTAFSVNVKERLDFSCAVLDAEGYLVVNAPHIPVHLGSLGICVRKVLAALPMEEGDVVVTNHPGFGGSHLPDITLISPVHDEAGQRVGFVANRAHHAEIGGKRPGSMPPDARNLAEEGVVIPPAYLVRKGKAQWDSIVQRLTESPFPSRAVHENIADLRAALASIGVGKSALQALCRTYGSDQVVHFMGAVKSYAATRLRKRLEGFPPGDYSAAEVLDDGSRIAVQIKVSPTRLRISFAGTSGTHPRNLNATPAIVASAVIYVLRLFVDEDIPLNEGLMKAVDLHLPEGMLNPAFPDDPFGCPAVVGGNTETSQRVVDTLLKALQLAAGSQGTMNNVVFGNQTFGYYETIGGGTGAGRGFDGASAVHQHMTNTRITDPEVIELRYPVRLERFAVRRGSGGAGMWRGGDGIIREIRFLKPVLLTVLAEHRRTAPYGLAGGEPGQPGRQTIIRADGATEPMEGSSGAEMQPGDRIVVETPGGGGCGSPG